MRIFLLAILIAHSTLAMAGYGAGAYIMRLNPDATTEGMGGAGGAVWWTDAPAAWHNPALLGYHRGIGFHSGSSQLAPDLVDDNFLKSRRLTAGIAGIGFHLQLGGLETKWDMGTLRITDGTGEEIGRYEPCERYHGLGAGFSLGTFLSARADDGSVLDFLGRHVDVAGGVMRKEYQRSGDGFLQDSSPSAKTLMMDYGVMGRLSIYDSISGPGWLRPLDKALYPLLSGWSFTIAGSRSWLNWGDDFLGAEMDQAEPFPRQYRESRSMRVAFGLPGFLADGVTPLVQSILTPAFAYAKVEEDRWPGYYRNEETFSYEYGEDTSGDFLQQRTGSEITIFGIYTIRRGQVQIPFQEVDGDSQGWGLRCDLGGAILLRYDEATQPQPAGLERTKIKSWSVIVDTVKVVALLSG